MPEFQRDFKAEQLAKQKKKQTHANNPVGDDYSNLQDDGQRFLVAENLGGHVPGKVIGRLDLQPGAQVQRLVDGGHLQPLSEEEAETLLQDPDATPSPQAFPTATLVPPKPSAAAGAQAGGPQPPPPPPGQPPAPAPAQAPASPPPPAPDQGAQAGGPEKAAGFGQPPKGPEKK
jgi:hypothetical protein